MLDRYLNPQNDIAFKRIFGQERNKDLLLALINTVVEKQLHKPIEEAQLICRVQDPETVSKKTSILDLMCKDEDGCMYIIEMQVASSEGFKERAQYYASKAYINQAEKGGLYSSLKKVIFLAFTNYPIFPEKASYKSDHQILDIVTHDQNFKKLVFTIVDLATFDARNKKPLHELNLQEKFCYFLRHAPSITPDEVAAIIKDAPIMAKAFRALNRAYWTDEELQMYENQEKKDWDYRSAEYQRGIDEGKEKGIQLGKWGSS